MASLVRSSICQSCRQATSRQVRSFTSSSALAVGPESPNFVDIPRQVQPDTIWKKSIKGTLPVPRDIFTRQKPNKHTPEFVAAATQEPIPENALQPDEDPTTDMKAWRKKMAQTRRDNLRSGTDELYQRSEAQTHLLGARSEHKQDLQRRLIKTAEAKDKALAASSATPEFINQASLFAGRSEASLNAAKNRVKQIEARKATSRAEAVQELYMNARKFIVTEDQLDEVIKKTFPEGSNPAWKTDVEEGENIWNLGPPSSLADLVAATDRTTMADHEVSHAQQQITKKRLQKLAEEVTGGKM